jgi:L-ascorbate metabolism protein UlaG (beta-lactamase superfamily)
MRRLVKALKILAATAVVLAIIVYAVFQLPQFGGRFEGERLVRMKQSPQFIDGRFENVPPQDTDESLIKLYRLYRQGQIREPRFAVPVVPLEPSELTKPASRGLEAIWFGHASALVEIGGVRIMTDPVLSDVVSPLPPIGPGRLHPPPLALAHLSGIDAVVISHDHYDHLDLKTVQHLAKQGTHFFVPLGIGAHLERWKVPSQQIHEMDWWQSAEIKGVRIDCTPSRHYSGRKRMNNSTLWSSWVIRGGGHSVFFSGDTGYSPHFKEIRRRLGPMTLTLIKVGAYGETWLDIHMDPESAIQAHADLDGGVLLPIHWATFDLSYHAWEEPIVRARAAALAKGIDLITPQIGERFVLGSPGPHVRWWEGRPD